MSSAFLKRTSGIRKRPPVALDFSGDFRFGAANTTPFHGDSELLVFELTAAGDRQYMHMHVRGLYRYVLQAIMTRSDEESTTTGDDPPSTIKETVGMGDADPPAAVTKRSSVVDHTNGGIPSLPDRKPLLRRNTSVDPRFYASRALIDHPGGGATAVAAADGSPHHPVTYRERLGGYLHPRDMRRLVTPFSASNEPELIVRRHVMLLNFDPLRAIVLRDRLLVLVPTGADSILVQIEERVRQGSHENSIWEGSSDDPNASQHDIGIGSTHGVVPEEESSRPPLGKKLLFKKVSFTKILPNGGETEKSEEFLHKAAGGEDNDETVQEEDEWDEIARREWARLPFELQCAEAVLHVVSTILTDDTAELKEQCDEFMRQVLEFNIKDDPLTVLRIVKDAVLLMTNRVKAFNQSLNRLLSDDEDMALMNLSRLLTHPERFIQPVPQTVLDEESDEPELIIESNLQIGLSLLNVLQLLQGQVTSAKELVDQKQDATRNKLLFANMLLSVFSLCTTLAATVGSFFGMNVRLPVGDEEPTNDPAAYRPFHSIVYGTVGAAVTLCCFIMAVLWFTGTIPRTVKVPKTKFS
jgi:hypothetical protein